MTRRLFGGQELPRDLLDRLREVPFQDPAKETGLFAAHVFERAAAILSEIDRRLAVDEPEAAFRIEILVEPRAEEGVQLRDRPRQVLVAFELADEDLERHFRVRERAVCPVVIGLAVKTRRGGQVPRLASEEDPLGVHQAALADLEGDARPQELGPQHRQVKARDVVTGQVAPRQKLAEFPGDIRKPGLAGHVRVADPMDGRRGGGDRNPRIDAPVPGFPPPVGMDLHARDLDDAVRAGIGARGLGVEDDERPIERQNVFEHRP